MSNNFSQDTAHLQNDPAKNLNLRLPPLHYPGAYPYVTHIQHRSGSWIREDSTPNNESYSFGHIGGTFHEHTPLKGTKSLSAGMDHTYTSQGSTHTTDLNSHDKIGGSTVSQVSNDSHTEHYNDSMKGIGGNHIHAVGGVHFHHATAKNEMTSTGDWVTDHNDGNQHHNVEGDHVHYIGNTKYDYIGGEKGVYIPSGNYDVKVDQGKYQLSTGSDIMIKSATKITLQVGSSTIVITPSDITITTGTVNINKAS